MWSGSYPKCLKQGGVGSRAYFALFLHDMVALRVKPWYHQVSTIGSNSYVNKSLKMNLISFREKLFSNSYVN